MVVLLKGTKMASPAVLWLTCFPLVLCCLTVFLSSLLSLQLDS